ncbi:MAG: hypothetical protein ACREXU_12070 [Gammaproteobacteria bacterium]
MRWAAWRGAGLGLVFAALLIGGCSAPEPAAVELIYTEDQEPQMADFTAGKYDGMALRSVASSSPATG